MYSGLKRSFSFCWVFLTSLFLWSQDATEYLATLNGYCSGKITTSDLLKVPRIDVKTTHKNYQVEKISLFSNSTGKYVELHHDKFELSKDMINHISSLESGLSIYIDVQINNGKEVILLNPLFFEISAKTQKAYQCNADYRATILGEVHGKVSKEELLNSGELQIKPKPIGIKVKGYKMYAIQNGKRVVIACSSARFNDEILAMLKSIKRFERIYFSEIFVSIDGKVSQLNPIEIQIE